MEQIAEVGGSSIKLRIFWNILQGTLFVGSMISFGCKRIIIGVVLLQAEFILFYCLHYLREIGQVGSTQHRSQFYALLWKLSLVMLSFLSILIVFNLIFTMIIVIICGSSVNEDIYWNSLTNTLDGSYKAHFSIIIQILSLILQLVLSYLFYFNNVSQKIAKQTGYLQLFMLKDIGVLNVHNNICAICLEQLLYYIPSYTLAFQDNKEIIETIQSQLNNTKQDLSCSKSSVENHLECQTKRSKKQDIEENNIVLGTHQDQKDNTLSENNQKQQGLMEFEKLKLKCKSISNPQEMRLVYQYQGLQNKQEGPPNKELSSRNDRIINLNCNHLFHLECIQRWIESSSNQQCPTCRQGIQTN